MNIEQLAEAKQLTQEFINEFEAKYGIKPYVYYPENLKIPRTPLEYLEYAVNAVLFELDTDPKGIRNKTRDGVVLMHRQIAFYLSIKMGYSLSLIGRYFGWNHATVIHSRKVVDNYIHTKNKKFIVIYNKIENELQKRYGTDLYIQSHASIPTDTESDLSS